ncbi:MAG: 23S rRNA (uracil(1939)-C(5))-methyltransferase RlmD [Clostridiales bacterium]|nr:23S rRNA (uracil(1939)-C(5))-methyltransferase RlmD [Clostridiales bacterium]
MKTPPIKIKEFIDIHIESLNSEGQGVGRIDGYVVFVVGALPGEDCNVQIFKVTPKYAIARLVKYEKPSKLREKPVCSHYSKCGGCQIQHMKYPAQLLFKQSKVIQAIVKIAGKKEAIVSPTIGMDTPWFYRNKSIFSSVNTVEGTIVGMYQNHSHKVVEIDKCIIAHQKINSALSAAKDWIKRSNILAYDEIESRGDLRALFARVGVNTGQVMVGAITHTDSLPEVDTFTTLLRRADNDIVSIFQNINAHQKGERLSFDTKFIWGTHTIADSLGKLRFNISPYSFYQINPVQTKKLYDYVLEKSDLNSESIVLDAYCGVGTIGQYLAKQCKEVIGIESVIDAINDAKENSRINNIRNTKYIAGNCATVFPQLIDSNISFDVVIVDPPRKGCERQFIDALLKATPPKIIYVSCNPSTLARDIKALLVRYNLVSVQPFDMFPQTDHVETVTLLERKGSI